MLLQHLVFTQAQRRPNAPAIVCGEETITYGDLEAASNRLAWLLKAAGCQRGDRVGILLPKSIPAIAGMLGALKADCMYVPLDCGSPAPRLLKIVEACEPRCILVSAESHHLLQSLFPRGTGAVKLGWLSPGRPPEQPAFEFQWDDLPSVPPGPLPVRNDLDDAAHILFTSGSTGVPKGVLITHANILQFIQWATGYFDMAAADRISCHPPLHFDLSMFDIYGTFLAGGQLHLVPPEISLLPHKLASFIRTSRLTQWFSVPSALKYMAQFDVVRPGDFPAMKRLLWCGEALPTPVLMYFMKRLPHVTFTNLYGPTETTIASSYYTVPSRPTDEKAEIPIGTACDGEQLLVLDEALQPVTPGEIGDLYISGTGLSPGYWRDPEKTRSVFIDDPARGRIYKTGDLARADEQGLIYLLGRADSQIKSRGYRIELGEIESSLDAIGMLRECAVVAVRSDGFEGMSICCAYVPDARRDLSPLDLKARLAELLPSYMLPSRWTKFDALPLNANGKVDRPRLREYFTAGNSEAIENSGGLVCHSQRQ